MKKQTVPWFSVALVMKNKTPFDMLLYDIIATAGNDKYDIKSFCFRIKKLIFFENSNCIVHRCTMYNNYRT